MHIKSIQDILPWVEQPSGYLGSEVNRIKKPKDSVKLKFLLAFPDLYEIGTCHFGMQILYHLINKNPEMLAERVFAPAPDVEALLRQNDIPLASLESKTPIEKFDIIGFSLLYELNFTNILGMMALGKIPFLSEERGEQDPFIIAGGPCTSNPEPVADFFDAMVIGDGEGTIQQLTGTWLQWKESGGSKKDQLLEEWANIKGVYIPKFYQAVYTDTGQQRLRIKTDAPKNIPKAVRRSIIPELKKEDFPESPIVPFGRPIHDRLRLEIARGCSRGCRFCQAGMIYRPVRERSVDQLLSLTEKSLTATGYEDLSLLSLSTGDYGCIIPLMQKLMEKCQDKHIAVSFPSVRAGTITPELMELIKKVRKTGFTMAVEAGSQRLRDSINKNVTENDIFTTIEDAFELGWQGIKLYFMIGLPGETIQDLDEIVALVKKIEKIKSPRGRKGKINVSVNTFVPKSHTPFQWARQLSLEESKEKIFMLKGALSSSKVQFKWQNPENSYIEGLWARGDRRLSQLLITAYQKGCRLDGWSNHFSFEKWKEAIAETGINSEFFVSRGRDTEEPLPWDHIDVGIEKEYLKGEWEKSLKGLSTQDCRSGECTGCGVCDFQAIQPRLSINQKTGATDNKPTQQLPDDFIKTLTLVYSKLGNARFFGHLELANIFLRAMRRAGIAIAYSQGFHPLPKISFEDPLPCGYESLEEAFRIRVPVKTKADDVLKKLNATLPEGLLINACFEETKKIKDSLNKKETYQLQLTNQIFDNQKLEEYLSAEEYILASNRRKGKIANIDLKKVVRSIKIIKSDMLNIEILQSPGQTVRPGTIIEGIFSLSPESMKECIIKKVSTEYIGQDRE